MKSNEDIFISIVVPMFNESENIGILYERLTMVLANLNRTYEVICVNDGSRDDTLQKMIKINQMNPRFKIIDLSRNFGKEIALSAGLDYASGEVVVPIDADLQDPPELIYEMIEKWNEGYDVVYAVRTQRDGESWFKKSTAALFYKIIGKISPIDIPGNTGDFRLMSRQAVDAIKELRETHRFMKGLFGWIGFRQAAIMYNRDARYAGKTKWNYGKLWNLALEGITSFSYMPLQWSMYFGFFVAFNAFLYGIYMTIRTLLYGNPVPGYPSLMVMVLFLGGVQLFTIGIIGEYIGRIYTESKHRPLYFVRESRGFNEEK
ncbi:MAG: glycosyltransferase family 2 protein [Syntrophomonas sp.]|nr:MULTISPECIES: glycosyltransferase family 2 protein [Syntrophomonas]MDD3879101.1 glycosyltransferase family 2 protein [Syntrophomonas sp.]MDD4626598.1 glycosyltransferase family 2 protein [Syntrophomonas sp.]